ncbi:hypothetical protein [Pseudoalteromonas rhizosphaerae]|uniref:ABC transmembrane type-1 domain-containing protein n=1 Tax=Pseudoalteromonas rhizosphaerae TaxID=2518973 RepID=A0ABW8KZC0_9GAMM
MIFKSRIFDFYKLKPSIKNEISVFLVIGFIPSMYLIGKFGYQFQIWLGVEPGTPIRQIENGFWLTALLVLCAMVIMACGLFAGAVLHALYLAITGRLSLSKAFAATVLNKYPVHWFKF